MPIFEYRCETCTKVTAVLVRSPKKVAEPVCEHCGSRELKKMISAAARPRSAGEVLDEYGIPREGVTNEYRDPRQLGSWVEKRFEQFGVDIPDSSRALIDAARDGVLPREADI